MNDHAWIADVADDLVEYAQVAGLTALELDLQRLRSVIAFELELFTTSRAAVPVSCASLRPSLP